MSSLASSVTKRTTKPGAVVTPLTPKKRASWIDQLERATDRFATLGVVERNAERATFQGAIDVARHEVKRLRDKLNAQWAWFDAHPDDPGEDKNTEAFLRLLKQYEDGERVCAAAEAELQRCH